MKKEDKKTTSRAADTRTKTERPKEYKPPSSLDAPPAPDGFRHRWIRAESVGFQDSKNIYGRLREGYELVRADEYYAEIDKRIRVDFPHKFDKSDNKYTTEPVQTVASARRSVKPGRKTVRLTSSQVAIAKKLGVPLEEYAKQLKLTEGA